MAGTTKNVSEDGSRKPGTSDTAAATPADRGDARAQPSGFTGQNPATAGPGPTEVHTDTPENAAGQIDPSAPGRTGTTPGTNG